MSYRFPRTIFHLDADAFFASVEQVIHPHLRGCPVIVGGLPTDRSVVASASYEARDKGVRTAMPLAQARRLCPNAAFLRGDFRSYLKASRTIFDICRSYSPLVEPVSLDEAFLDMTGLVDTPSFSRASASPVKTIFPSPLPTAERLKLHVRRVTGLPVSIGIASTKLVAKIASDFAKPDGIAFIRPGCEQAFLASLDVDRIPGVGRVTRRRLALLNVDSVSDLRDIPEKLLRRTFGANGQSLSDRARAHDPSPVKRPALPKSIARETTFENDTADRALVEGMLAYLLARAARELRSIDMMARTVTVKLRYADFSTHVKACSLSVPSQHDDAFFRLALQLLDSLWHKRMRVRLVGVALSSLIPQVYHQLAFFDQRPFLKRDNLYRSLDRVRDRFGFSAVTSGRAIHLLGKLNKRRDGFQLRTPSLTQ